MAFHWIGKSSDGKTVTLKRLSNDLFQYPSYYNAEWAKSNQDAIRTACAIDIETTGLSYAQDQIIELGIRQFLFNRMTGEVLKLTAEYQSFQDPGQPLSDEIKELTGIQDQDLKNQKIDWAKADQLLNASQLVIAHNASFDRPFVDRASSVSAAKIWGCSCSQIDWHAKGYNTAKLDLLSIYHGFFTDSHRALNDADALIYLLSQKNALTEKPYLLELLENAKKVTVHMIAASAPFEAKDLLKNRNYRWDGQNKFWNKHISKDQFTEELKWLEDQVYHGTFRGRYQEIQAIDQFKVSG